MKMLADRCHATAPLLLAGLLAGCSVLAGCNKPGAAEWTTTTVDDRFAFQMPGEPKIQTQKQDTPVGEVELKLYNVQLDHATRAYSFTATDLPAVLAEPQGEEIEQRLDGAELGAVANVKGKLLNREKIKIAGYSGRDCLIQLPSAAVARMRVTLVHRTMVVMEVINVNSKDADRFFDSLKLLKDSAPPEPAKPQGKS